jgi:hypothetical protein
MAAGLMTGVAQQRYRCWCNDVTLLAEALGVKRHLIGSVLLRHRQQQLKPADSEQLNFSAWHLLKIQLQLSGLDFE